MLPLLSPVTRVLMCSLCAAVVGSAVCFKHSVIMEESEKRRERLKAMRMEAAQGGANADSEGSELASHGLSNPMIERESTMTNPIEDTSRRFEYYTDPMSAFSGSKRRNNFSPQVSHGFYNTTPRPTYLGMNPSSSFRNPAMDCQGQRMFQVPGAHNSQSCIVSSVQAASPSIGPQGYPPHAWGGSAGSFSYSSPPNLSPGDKFTRPIFGRGDSPYVNYGRGRGQGYSSSYYGSGEARGRSHSISPGSGPSGGRGAGSREIVSAVLRPDLYYSKEMIKDPWEQLKPVIWKGVNAQDSQKSCLPKSISMKKARASPEPSQRSFSQPSLAEYLAASFNDPINEAVSDEQGT